MRKVPGSSRFCFFPVLILLITILWLAHPANAQEPQRVSGPTNQNAQPDSQAGKDSQAQTSEKETAKDTNDGQPKSGDAPGFKENDRMLFVMPNYLSARNEAETKPLNWKEKFKITAKGAFDPYEFAIVGVLSGIRQANDSYPSFGQGTAGYGKRYGTAFADQVDGNMMVGAVYPSILHTDPRYFQIGEGSFGHRFFYAFSRIFVAKKDSGGHTFNLAEVFGNASAIGISALYYPAQDRSGQSFMSGWGVQMGVDALGNELKEFWPDLHRMWDKRKKLKLSP